MPRSRLRISLHLLIFPRITSHLIVSPRISSHLLVSPPNFSYHLASCCTSPASPVSLLYLLASLPMPRCLCRRNVNLNDMPQCQTLPPNISSYLLVTPPHSSYHLASCSTSPNLLVSHLNRLSSPPMSWCSRKRSMNLNDMPRCHFLILMPHHQP